MVLAIDMIGTNLGSGTKTYNLNFCENLSQTKIENKIYIFITREYFESISHKNNDKIKYIIKPNFFKKYIFKNYMDAIFFI